MGPVRCELLEMSCSEMDIVTCQVRFLNFSFLKPNIYARIIAPCAVDIVIKTLAVVFKRELLGFRHVGRLEHHAIAPVARLPK
jgi:hypothetical protein